MFGLLTDGRLMTRTAFAIAELGELGIARGHRVEIRRPEGDAVTRYGLGPSFARVLPMLAAESVERRFGPGASQTLLVAEQIAFLLLAALCAGLLVESWGGGRRDAARALLACGLASPLAAYAGSDFSEPLQAALVAATFLFASRAALSGSGRAAVASGACAGLALLSKSFFIVVLPAVLALVFFAGERSARARRALLVLAGWALVAAVWLFFEISRFGRPFAGYQGEHFSNPPLDGLWRLTVGPNKGLLVFFPLAILAVPGGVVLARRSRPTALAVSGFCLLLLGSTAAWWAWDGTAGWGPRLLLPAVPLLASLAALGAAAVPRMVFAALFAAGICVNALGVFQPDALTTWYLTILAKRPLSEAEAARYPDFAYERGSDGVARLFQIHEAARHAALSQVRLSAWLLKTRLLSRDVLAALQSPPWDPRAPGLQVAVRPEEVMPSAALDLLTSSPRWPHLGMSLGRRSQGPRGALAFIDALQSQALRAQDMRKPERAVAFGERLYDLTPGPQSAAILLEGLRMAGQRERIASWLRTLPPAHTSSLEFGLTLALFERDIGDEAKAREIANRVAAASKLPITARLSQLPTSAWPARLRDLNRSAPGD